MSAAFFVSILANARVFAALGEAAQPSSTSNKIAGIFAGLVLAGLVTYAMLAAARPLIENRARGLAPVLLALLALLSIKVAVVAFVTGYQVDVGTYEAWALQIAAGGPVSMYQTGFFIDYPPGYLYALWAAGWFASVLGVSSTTALRIIVEMPALVADFALAALVYIFVRRRAGKASAWAATLMVALNPALLFDTVAWGQTDSVLTLVLLLSVVMMLDNEIELAWGLAALGLLIKPQSMMLLPVLLVWTIREVDFRKWWRAALAFIAIIIVVAAPFQVAHAWNWLPELYLSSAGYYQETSVNAFNLMALLGGLRQSDAGTILGISYFSLGVLLLFPVYLLTSITLWRYPTPRNFIFCAFIALFGFFVLAPRMHERYLYAAIVFGIPLAVEEAEMLAVFLLLTVTGLLNLAYVLHALNTVLFLDARDRFAMTVSAVNVLALAIAATYGYAQAAVESPGTSVQVRVSWFRELVADVRTRSEFGPSPDEASAPFPWLRLDSALIFTLILAAAALRFWHLGHPAEIVFDEVHFVGQARHYLRGEPFLDPHPPLAKLVIALGILVFGDHPWSWRLGNATLGTLLVGVTYMLGRRMFRSRLAATLAGAFVACDGFFIVDSRIGCIDIVYLTFAAISYLLLFRFIETPDLPNKRRTLLALSAVLGLCLGSKLYVPGVTLLLAAGFVAYSLWRQQSDTALEARMHVAAGAMLILGSISAIVYLAAFLPHYIFGWWGGIQDLGRYYVDVMGYEKSVSTATHPYASPWWSWPLMLRPVAYWQNFPQKGDVATIWGAGNPLTWWAVIPAMTITAVRALERPNIARVFMVTGFLAYFVIWIPIGRVLFLYHYMPSVYIGYLALGGVLADCWNGEAEMWENLAIMLTIAPVLLIGLEHFAYIEKPLLIPAQVRPFAGLPFAFGMGATYVLLIHDLRRQNRFVFILFVVAAAVLFAYFLPVWLGTPIPRQGYYSRMWFEGPGLRNWI